MPFGDIAAIVGRTPEATRQLASRARRRVRGASAERNAATQRKDELVRAFLQASRAGNFSALLALLDPAATLRADAAVMAMGGATYFGSDKLQTGIKGAHAVAQTFIGRARAALAVFVDGQPAAAWMHGGQLRVAFLFRVKNERIAAIEMVGNREALARSVIERPSRPGTP